MRSFPEVFLGVCCTAVSPVLLSECVCLSVWVCVCVCFPDVSRILAFSQYSFSAVDQLRLLTWSPLCVIYSVFYLLDIST